MPQLDFDGANSKVSADKIQGQSGTTVTIPTGHKIAGTDANSITINGVNAVAVAPSTSGNVLTSTGSAWASSTPAAGGTNGWHLIGTNDVTTGVNAIVFTNISTSYVSLKLVGTNITGSAAALGNSVILEYSTDNGTSYINSGYWLLQDNVRTHLAHSSSIAIYQNHYNNQALHYIPYGAGFTGNTAGPATLKLDIDNLTVATHTTMNAVVQNGWGAAYGSSGNGTEANAARISWGKCTSTAVCNAFRLRLIVASHTIDNGSSFRLYGMARS